MLFDQTFKNLKRAREIIAVLLKHGFEEIVVSTPLKNLVPKTQQRNWTRDEKPVFAYSRSERLRMVCEELGPTFIKGAQVLSNRPDILPKELIEEFEKLQSQVPPFEYEIAKNIIETELSQSLDDVFSHFTKKPIGSASIGQVHRARLHNGEDVVIKVQRPRVRQVVETDIAIMREIVRIARNYFEKNGISHPMDVVDAFEKSLYKELDYTIEARNIQLFRETFKKNKQFYVPKAYRAFSTNKVLVLELIKGCKITDTEQLSAWGMNPAEIAERGLDIYLTQIFEYGFFHADPHPGNILIRKDGVICLIDFGMVGKLMRRDKYAFAGVLIAMGQHDATAMAKNLRKLAIDDNIQDMRALEYDLNELIEDFAMLDVGDASVADMATRLQKIIYDYSIRVPGGVFIILRALTILEGIGKKVHPRFNAFDFVKPYGVKLLKDQYSAENISLDLMATFTDFSSFMYAFPSEVKDILKKMRLGDLHVNIDIVNHEHILDRLDYVVNRLSLTLIIVALIIGSSIMMNTDLGPAFKTEGGISYFSIAGFLIAGGLGFILVFNMLRKKK